MCVYMTMVLLSPLTNYIYHTEFRKRARVPAIILLWILVSFFAIDFSPYTYNNIMHDYRRRR